MRLLLLYLCCLLACPLLGQDDRGWIREKKVALVIGNSEYDYARNLRGVPENDARDIAVLLRDLGFIVIEKYNCDQNALKGAIRDFAAKAKRAEIAFFFYAGHGLQTEGINYLLPKNADIYCDWEIPGACVSMDHLLRALEAAETHVNILVLDACRDNPFQDNTCEDGRSLQKQQQSYSPVLAPDGTFIAFSTSPGEIAKNSVNRLERNSPYTQALKKYLRQECIPLPSLFQNVRTELKAKTNDQQKGWDHNSTTGTVYLKCTEDIDSDGDGILNSKDQCPNRKGPIRNNGCPEVDSDGDGILDSVDKCPDEPGTNENLGCPLPDDMVFVKGGWFDMGCTAEQGDECDSDEEPKHQVKVNDFYLSATEVTVAQFEAFVNATDYETTAEKEGWSYIWNGSEWGKKTGVNWRHGVSGNYRLSTERNHPIIHVSWHDAVAYCEWRSAQDPRRTYRLPTEAEWEYAARGGQKSKGYKYSGANNLDEVGWYKENSNLITHPVGQKFANELGLYDMSGNVYEWVADQWHSNYEDAPKNGSAWIDRGGVANRVVRGGDWLNNARFCRVSNRNYGRPDYRYCYVGFRLAVVLQ